MSDDSQTGAELRVTRGSLEYPDSFPKRRSPNIFERAIRIVFPGMSDAQLATVFRPATRWNIKDWRRGKASMPQWARDIVFERFEPVARTIDELRAAKPAPGIGWNKTGRGAADWQRARRKEKAPD